ncbi:MAG: N-acetyltransferase [Acidobacteria bacterium]|jgi:amino-acid N-acetyltransferase|nr:MAG: N-acetyltransferase [Acidobacteriota bacterium]
MQIRKALVRDAVGIYSLVNIYAKDGILLPRSLNSIYENLRDFWVCYEGDELVGCCALHVVWEDLAEIKSLAVKHGYRGRGIGKALVEACIREAKELGISRVFVLTYAVGFFTRFSFEEVSKDKLPHKVWGECINCVKFPSCDETALLLDLSRVSVGDECKV